MKICLSSLTGGNKRSLLLVMVLGSSQNSKWNMSVVDNTWQCAVSLQQHGFLVCSETLCHLPSPISVKNMLLFMASMMDYSAACWQCVCFYVVFHEQGLLVNQLDLDLQQQQRSSKCQ